MAVFTALRRAVGVHHVRAGLEHAVAHLLDHLRGLLAQDLDGFVAGPGPRGCPSITSVIVMRSPYCDSVAVMSVVRQLLAGRA
jgi:hypothetical protein